VIPDASTNDLKKRKLIESRNDTWFSIKKGPNYAPKRVKPETDLTRELLQRYAWVRKLSSLLRLCACAFFGYGIQLLRQVLLKGAVDASLLIFFS
jgi:hypothetical protein